jgi:hypothetical protein
MSRYFLIIQKTVTVILSWSQSGISLFTLRYHEHFFEEENIEVRVRNRQRGPTIRLDPYTQVVLKQFKAKATSLSSQKIL